MASPGVALTDEQMAELLKGGKQPTDKNQQWQTTTLRPEEEVQFQGWVKGLPWYSEFKQNYGEEPNLNDPMYDYRGAWKAGITPSRNQYDGNKYHWSSQFKSPDHPTMWMEKFMQQTGIDPGSLGLKTEQEGQAYIAKMGQSQGGAKSALTDEEMAALMGQSSGSGASSPKPDASTVQTGSAAKKPNFALPDGVVRFKAGDQWLTTHADVGEAFMLANQEYMKATGKPIKINSSFRSTEQQQKLYDELKPKGARVAKPGNSLHEKGMALDIQNWKEAEPYLRKHGFENPFGDDKGHFQIAKKEPSTGQKIAKAVAPYSKTVLPFAGATAGGVIAAPMNLFAPGVAEIAGTAGGFGIGVQLDRMLQEYAGTKEEPTQGEKIYGKDLGPVVDAGTDIAMMLGLGPLGASANAWRGGMNVMKGPVMKAGAKEVEALAGTKARQMLSEETKVPLTPAQTGQAKSTTYLEGQLRKNMWSADEAAAFDAEQQKALQDYALKVQKTEFKGSNDPSSAGSAAKDATWNRIGKFREKGGKLYDQVPVKPETPIETQNLKNVATTHAEELGKMESPTIKRILNIAQKSEAPATMSTSPIVDAQGRPIQTETPPQPTYTWQELRADQSKLGKMVQQTSDNNTRRIYNDLIRGISDDIGAFAESVENPEVKKSLETANKYWRYGDSIFGPTRTGVDLPGMRTFGRKQIKRLLKEESPEKIGRTFFKAQPNRSDIRALREASGEKGFNEIRQSWLEDMISKGEGGSFNHAKFATWYDKYRMSGNLEEMLTESQIKGLDKLYEISRAVQWSEKIGGNPSGTGHMVINDMRKWVTHPVYSYLEARGAKDLAKRYFNDPKFQKKLTHGLSLPSDSPRARMVANQLMRMSVVGEREYMR